MDLTRLFRETRRGSDLVTKNNVSVRFGVRSRIRRAPPERRLRAGYSASERLRLVSAWLQPGVSLNREGISSLPRQTPRFQTAQQGTFLPLVRIHPAQDVIEHPDRVVDVWTLVQHHAFGALPHRRVGNFRARGLPQFGE